MIAMSLYNISNIQLWKADHSSIAVSNFPTATITTTGGTSGTSTNYYKLSASAGGALVDNFNNSYYLVYQAQYPGSGAAEQEIKLSRVLITYTVNKAD